MRVAVGGEDLINFAFAAGDQFQNRNIESASAEIVNSHAATALFVQSVGERGGGGFVHQAQNFEAGEAAGIFCGLPLRVIEVRGHGDDRAIDRVLEKFLGPRFQFAKNE